MSREDRNSYYLPPRRPLIDGYRPRGSRYPVDGYDDRYDRRYEERFVDVMRAAPRPQPAGRPQRSRRMAAAKKTALCMAIIMIFAINVGAVYVVNILNKITYTDPMEAIPENLDEVVIEEEEQEPVEVPEDAIVISDIGNRLYSDKELRRDKDVKNILLLGTDNRSKSFKSSRTDVMMILSVNEKKKKIVLSSLMRDTYITIPGRTNPDKLNAAHAYGGAALAIKTVETNYGIDIDNYVLVDFYAFMDIVDALGGLELDVQSERERQVINECIREINWHLGVADDTSGFLKTYGSDVYMTGKQALGYVRNRTTGASDFRRTERQRIVMTKIIKKLRRSSAKTLLDVIDATAGHMATDYSRMELVSLAASAADYKNYDIIQKRYPMDGAYVDAYAGSAAVLKVDFDKIHDDLIDTIYG